MLVKLVERDRATVVRVVHRGLRLLMSPTDEAGFSTPQAAGQAGLGSPMAPR
jgi:hypothetical protein